MSASSLNTASVRQVPKWGEARGVRKDPLHAQPHSPSSVDGHRGQRTSVILAEKGKSRSLFERPSPRDNYVRDTVLFPRQLPAELARVTQQVAEGLKLLDSEGETATSLPGQEKLRRPHFPLDPHSHLRQGDSGGIMEKSMNAKGKGRGVGPGFAALLV